VTTLANALRGSNPELSAEWAADALARKRRGVDVLGRAIRGRKPFRRAALYGFVWVRVWKARDFERVVEILEDRTEAPAVRGQAAEAMAGHIRRNLRSREARRRHERARAALDDPEPEVRFWSIYALASPENVDLLPLLERLVGDQPGSLDVGPSARRSAGR
jgi:HEAT repeat protein